MVFIIGVRVRMTGLTGIKEAFLGKELTHLNKVSQKSGDQGENAICQTCLGQVLKYKERDVEIGRAVYESATRPGSFYLSAQLSQRINPRPTHVKKNRGHEMLVQMNPTK
jgi:hypothetical protein